MGRAQRIIDMVMRDSRTRSSRAFSEKVYRDEPILITASQMRQFLPREYREMRAIATSPEARFKPSTWVFAQQAKFMEGFEDDYPYSGEFVRYFPTYMAMSEEQLRGYFSWRAKLRHGEAPEGPTSFAFVYIYELLNGAGWSAPEQGFALLRNFYEQYGAQDSTIRRHLKRWLVDFAVWYGVAPERLGGLVEFGREEAIKLLDRAASMDASQMEFERGPQDACRNAAACHEGMGRNVEREELGELPASADAACAPRAVMRELIAQDERLRVAFYEGPWDWLFAAIVTLSTYRIESSRLFKEYPNEFRRALCGVCAALAKHCVKHRKTSFSEGLFGAFREDEYIMFQNAVFYNDGRHPEATHELSDGHVFMCRGGRWRQRRRVAMNRGPKFGAIVKVVDARVREELGMGAPLKAPALPKYMERIVTDEARAAVAWERAHKPFELNLDVSKLSGIRSAASETCEALLVDEERDAGADSNAAFSVTTLEVEAHMPGRSGGFELDGFGDGSSAFPDRRVGDAAHGFDSASSAGERGDYLLGSSDHAVAASLADTGGEINECPLDGPECRWVTALLESDSLAAHDVLAASGLTDDLMADAVNEKLFDYLGDTAVEWCDGGYAVVEDYREDVEGLIR